jgi:uncharacterized protein (DUF885 family)
MRILFIVVLLSQSLISAAQAKSGDKFKAMLESYYEAYLRLNPTTATSIGDYRYNDQMENSLSQSYRDQSRNLYSRYLDSLKLYNRQQLSARDQLSYQIFQYDLARNVERFRYATWLAPISQMGDFRLSFSQLGGGTGNHPFKTVKDYDDFLKRMDAFVSITDTAIENMRKGITAKRVSPKVVVDKVIPQIKAMITDTITKSLFYNPIKNLPAEFSSSDKDRLIKDYTNAIQQKIIPAYQKLLTFLQNEYMQQARPTVGMLALDGGKDEYAFLVKAFTTTNLTPDEVFVIGENEVKRIHGEMEKIKQQVGFDRRSKRHFLNMH